MGTTAGSLANDEMQTVADALRDAASDAADHAAKVRRTAAEGGSQALRGLSRFAYASSYVLSYGIVYTVVFAAHSLPQENSVMHGLRDGGRAAKNALKSEE